MLILSENAGAHDELGEWALTVNPFDVAGQAEAIHEALTMAADERRRRREAIAAHVREHDIARWIAGQLADLDEARDSLASPASGVRVPAYVLRRASDELSHVDESGAVHMVDVGAKPAARRRAVARAFVRMRPETAERLRRRFRRATLWPRPRSPGSWPRSAPPS